MQKPIIELANTFHQSNAVGSLVFEKDCTVISCAKECLGSDRGILEILGKSCNKTAEIFPHASNN